MCMQVFQFWQKKNGATELKVLNHKRGGGGVHKKKIGPKRGLPKKSGVKEGGHSIIT